MIRTCVGDRQSIDFVDNSKTDFAVGSEDLREETISTNSRNLETARLTASPMIRGELIVSISHFSFPDISRSIRRQTSEAGHWDESLVKRRGRRGLPSTGASDPPQSKTEGVQRFAIVSGRRTAAAEEG